MKKFDLIKTDFARIFNERQRDTRWNTKRDIIQTAFIQNLMVLKFADENQFEEKWMRSFQRLAIGYNGVGCSFQSGIQSDDSIGLSSNETTHDHLLGATEVGIYVHELFKEKNYDIDFMLNDWLYEHLFLWATVKITREEHHKDNIIRNKHDLKQKLNLEHYLNVSDIR